MKYLQTRLQSSHESRIPSLIICTAFTVLQSLTVIFRATRTPMPQLSAEENGVVPGLSQKNPPLCKVQNPILNFTDPLLLSTIWADHLMRGSPAHEPLEGQHRGGPSLIRLNFPYTLPRVTVYCILYIIYAMLQNSFPVSKAT